MKCLEKAPSKRYASAAALADDLERWLAGEAIAARPATALEKLHKWVRRRPVLAATSGLGAAAAAVLATVLVIATVLFQQQRNIAREMANDAEASRHETRLNLYAADMDQAARAIEIGNLGVARAALARHLPEEDSPDEDLRGFEWFAYSRLCEGQDRLTLAGHGAAVCGVAFDPTGTTLATVSRDETLRLWSVADGEVIGSLPHPNAPGPISEIPLITKLIAKSPDLRRSLFSPDETYDGIRFRGRPSRLAELTAVAWSPDGRRIATGSYSAFVRIWNVEDMSLVGLIPRVGAKSTAFTPDGNRLVVAAGDVSTGSAAVSVHDLSTFQRTLTIPHSQPCFALSPGRTAPRDRARSGTDRDHPPRRRSGPAQLANPQPGRSDRLLARRENDHGPRARRKKVSRWNAQTGTPINFIDTAETPLRTLVYTTDGSAIIGAGNDHAVHIFDADDLSLITSLRGHEDGVLACACAPDGRTIATASNDHTARLWSLDAIADAGDQGDLSAPPTATPPDRLAFEEALHARTDKRYLNFVWSRDGSTIAGTSWPRTVSVWDRASRPAAPDLARLRRHLGQHRPITRRKRLATAAMTI